MSPRIRRTPGAAQDAGTPTEIPAEVILREEEREAASKVVAAGGFLPYIYSLPPAECELREVWIFRAKGEKPVPNQKGRRVEVVPLPVDENGYCNLEDYIQRKHGGGDYELFVKLKGPGNSRPNDAHGYCYLDGPPKYPAVDPATVPGYVPAAAPAGGDAIALEMFRASQRQDPIKDARETLGLVKELGESMKPAPATDQISQLTALAGLLRSLTPPVAPVAPVDPFEVYRRMRETFKEIAAEAAPATPAVGRTSELVELGKAGLGELAVRIYGQQQEPASFGSAAGEALGKLIQERPGAIGQAWDIFTQAVSSISARLSPASATPPAPQGVALQPVGQVLPPETTTSQTDGVTQPRGEAKRSAPGAGMPPQEVIDDIFGIVVSNFRRGLDGTTVGIIILGSFPRMQPFLQMVCSNELADVLPDLRQQPVIAPICDDPRFPDFYATFREMCLAGLPTGEPEDESNEEDDEFAAAADGGFTASDAAQEEAVRP